MPAEDSGQRMGECQYPSGMINVNPGHIVRRVPVLSVKTFIGCQYEEPLILTGGMANWRIFGDLSRLANESEQLSYLKTMMGQVKVDIAIIPAVKKGLLGVAPELGGPDHSIRSERKYGFSQVCSMISRSLSDKSSPRIYMQSHAVQNFPDLCKRIGRLPEAIPSSIDNARKFRRVWIGSGGHIVNLHYDDNMNFCFMLAGQKRFTLFPFHALPNLYPAPLDKGIGGAPASCVRLSPPDFKKYPRLEIALKEMRVAHLKPGEILYLPPYWWHHVESIGLNAMINEWICPISKRHSRLLYKNEVEALDLFHKMPARARDRFKNQYLGNAFGGPKPMRNPAMISEAAASTGRDNSARRIKTHFDSTVYLNSKLPQYYRKRNKTFYQHYIFLSHGDPMPCLPGEFVRMVERMRGRYSISFLPEVGWESYRQLCMKWARLNAAYLGKISGGPERWMSRMNLSAQSAGPRALQLPAKDVRYIRHYWRIITAA